MIKGIFVSIFRQQRNQRIFDILLNLAMVLAFTIPVNSADVRSIQSGNWSNANIWDQGYVPGAGDNVLVDSGHVVTYDIASSDAIRLIHVRGHLEFSRLVDTQLEVGMIIVTTKEFVDVNVNCSAHHHGPTWQNAPPPSLQVGSIDNPIPQNINAVIRLVYFSDMSTDCAPGIISYGGRMDFHGFPLNKTWTKLGQTASSGTTTLILSEPVNWNMGDHIIVTGTNYLGNLVQNGSYRNNNKSQTEERYITSVNGNTITIDSPLNHSHQGTGDFRGEVANLSRNVIIESKDPNGIRGHTMYHMGSLGSISYAEFAHLGKAGKLARYPIHFHVVQSTMRGSYVIGASIWDSDNRFVTVHGTNYMVVRDCVGYKSLGHGFFLENAKEVFNILDNNLSVLTFDTNSLPNQELPYDQNDGAGFWWANGRNSLTNNVAVECDGYGFQFDIPSNIYASVLQPDGTVQSNVQVNRLPFVKFDNNEVHGGQFYGLRFNGNGFQDDPFTVTNFKVWRTWYAFSPNATNFFVENLDVWKTAYGIYAKEPKNGKIINYNADDPGNVAMTFIDKPEGLITLENVTINESNEWPIRIDGQEPRPDAGNIHIRNYTITNTENDWDGAGSHNAQSSPDLTLYLHDWFGTNQDAKVIPSNQTRNDGLTYQTMTPIFQNTVKVAQTNVPFPNNPIALNDDLPPASVILYPAHAQIFDDQTSQITVTGTCSDESNISSVKVNGIAATSMEDNFSKWEVTLSNLSLGSHSIESKATDEHGNVELNPHKITVYVGVEGGVVDTGDDNSDQIALIQNHELIGNFPNPFNPETKIRFRLSNKDNPINQVRLTIFDVLGHRVKVLVNGQLPVGEHQYSWDATDEFGNTVASGIYIYELVVNNNQSRKTYREARKMLLVR